MYFGALVCVPCKTFFLRYTNDSVQFTCRKSSGDCDVTVSTRTQCKYCRYRKCLRVGMCRRVRPTKVEIAEGQLLCVVCNDIGNGVHFGAVTCEGCKKFFRRGLVESPTYSCKLNGNCVINPRTRNACRYCRFQKCLESGMSRGAIQMGRPSKSRSAGDTSTTTTDVLGLCSSSPVNLSFHAAATAGPTDRPAGEGPRTGDVAAQQPDSTVDRCPLTAATSRKRSCVNVLRQLQSSVRDAKHPSTLWSVERPRGPADLRVKRARHGGLLCPTAPVQSATVGARVSAEQVARWRWSPGVGEDTDTCLAGAVYDGAVGSPSVTSSGRRDSVDDDDDDEGEDDCGSPSPAAPRTTSTDLTARHRPRSSADRKQTGVERDGDVTATSAAAAAAGGMVTQLLDLDRLMAVSTDYWLRPRLPDENVMFADVHWEVIKRIIPAYDRFVNLSTTINRSLSAEFDMWIRYNPDPKLVPKWIQNKVIPAYTILSVAYCKSLPGFSSFDTEDQITIVRLGQSSSRVLVAALHWYDSDRRTFRNFLSWRAGGERRAASNTGLDLFKQQLVRFSETVIGLELDPVEAAMLNVLLITASDFPNLRGVAVIEEARQRILSTFRAYTTAKYGTPNYRLETIFSSVPDARRLGLLHYMMTTTQTMTAEEVESRLKSSSARL